MILSLNKAFAFFTTKQLVDEMITAALATRDISIDAANYTDLVTNYPPASNNGAFAWVEASQGTAWLPGTVGGTYYPLGLYHSNGTDWVFTPSPSQATQLEVDTGLNNDKFVTPLTFTNASKWATRQDVITASDSDTGTWYPTMVSGAGTVGATVHINTTGFKVIGSSLETTGDVTAKSIISNNGGTGSTSALSLAGNNGYGGTNYFGVITLNNTGSADGKKYIRITPTGNFEIINSAYSQTIFSLTNAGNLSIANTVDAPNLTSSTLLTAYNATINNTLTATGTITGNNMTAFVAGPNAVSAVSLQVPNESAIRNIGSTAGNSIYFDVNLGGASDGQFKFRGSNSVKEYAVINQDGITSRTPCITKTTYNVPSGTEVTAGNFRFRISDNGGIFPQIISNTGAGIAIAWTSVGCINGTSINQTGSAGTAITYNSWTLLYTTHGMDSAGDNVVTTVQDKQSGKLFRVTFVRSDYFATAGYNIIVEQLI